MWRIAAHAHARTAPGIPFAVPGVTFPLASAFSMVGSHARLGGSRRMKSPPWHTLWTLFKRSQWLNQHLQGIVTHGRQVRARGPSRRRNAFVRKGRAQGEGYPKSRCNWVHKTLLNVFFSFYEVDPTETCLRVGFAASPLWSAASTSRGRCLFGRW